jgi:O-antigen/teichoic acid export membrane protein
LLSHLPKRPLNQTYVFVAGALVKVILNFLLIPRFGLIGAALAMVAAYARSWSGACSPARDCSRCRSP